MQRLLAFGLVFLSAIAFAGESPRRTPVVAAVERVGPSVVNISTEQIIVQRYDPFFGPRDRLFDDMMREFFGRSHEETFKSTSLGSGVIIDPDGYIATNEHVVRKASRIIVTLFDKTRLEGTLISASAEDDLAVVKVQVSKPLRAIQFATSSDLMIGEPVIALGNPYGLENTVTVGVLSAKNRTITAEGREVFKDLLQTDAAINPGNSGGPLLNIEGKLIGINTAIYAGAQGIGFAIPSDRARALLADLLDYRQLHGVWLGIRGQDLTAEIARGLGVPVDSGVLVVEADKKGPAARAGIKDHAIIVAVDGVPVHTLMELNLAVLKRKAGDTLTLLVHEGSKQRTVAVRLAEAPAPSGKDIIAARLGLEVQAVKGGLLIKGIRRGTDAQRVGIRPGDILVQVGRFPTKTVDQLVAILERVRPGTVLPVFIAREDEVLVARVRIE